MNNNTKNVCVIAQKEFADYIWSSRFIVILAIFTLVIFTRSHGSGIEVHNSGSQYLTSAFMEVMQVVGLFVPLIGIILGFDTIIKEKKSGSLNVLLTHPIYRDNIITGKLLGAMTTLALVVLVSTTASVGTLLVSSGVAVNNLFLVRIAISMILTFFYVLIFLMLGVLTSILVNDATDAIVYDICIWLLTCVLFGYIGLAIASIITGQTLGFGIGEWDRLLEVTLQIYTISPVNHYSEVILGNSNIGWGGVSVVGNNYVGGIFDTRYTLNQWFDRYWMDIVVLIVTPLILLIISFLAFLRKDITR